MTAPAPGAGDKSCLTCPNYVSPQTYGTLANKSFGTGYCKAFNVALGMPSWNRPDLEATLKKIGDSCGSYGQPISVNINKGTTPVAGDWSDEVLEKPRRKARNTTPENRSADL